MTAASNGDAPGDLDTSELDNGKFIWVWTSPGGRTEQSSTHYKRRGDARKAGREWLAKRGLP